MPDFINVCGPVVADTAYVESKLVARDVAFSLPEVTAMTVDLPVMGTMTMPIWQLIEQMEATITKIGADFGLVALITPDMKPIEFRWVQTVTNASGIAKNVGCKAFIRGVPTKIPSLSVQPGSTIEGEVPISVTRYNLFVDGKEMFLIDRMAGKVTINGVDYTSDVQSML